MLCISRDTNKGRAEYQESTWAGLFIWVKKIPVPKKTRRKRIDIGRI